MSFNAVIKGMQKNFDTMTDDVTGLFVIDVNMEEFLELYINSFSNRTRKKYRCDSCLDFIKRYGNIVTINEGQVHTIWGYQCRDAYYQPMLDSMDGYLKGRPVTDVFVIKQMPVIMKANAIVEEDGTYRSWEHLYLDFSERLLDFSPDTKKSVQRAASKRKDKLQYMLENYSEYALTRVLDLIEQEKISKALGWGIMLDCLYQAKIKYENMDNWIIRNNYLWELSNDLDEEIDQLYRHRIGTLITDISNGAGIRTALRRYELSKGLSNVENSSEPKNDSELENSSDVKNQNQKRNNEINSSDNLYAQIADEIIRINEKYKNKSVEEALTLLLQEFR